jgi:hypothetical protein
MIKADTVFKEDETLSQADYKLLSWPSLVVHICNPSYLGGSN